MTDALQNINNWFNKALKNPTKQTFVIQLGCCLEEIYELTESIKLLNYTNEHADSFGKESLKNLSVKELATQLKKISKTTTDLHVSNVECLDALGDVIVTVVGLFNILKKINHLPDDLKLSDILNEINESNFSKFDQDGNPIFNEYGKIMKSENFRKPDMEQFLK